MATSYKPSRPGMVQPKRDQGVFEEGMMPPEDIDSASATPEKPKRLPFGAKTGIEAAALEDAFKKDYRQYGSSGGPQDDNRRLRALDKARNEARGEIKRETRGKAPKAYANGGSVKGAGAAKRGVRPCKYV